MLKYVIFFWLMFGAFLPLRAQEWEGLLLVNVVEVGAIDRPHHLFLADVGRGSITELLVENKPFFAPWFGFSPNGQKFAYLAPARRGINYELWLADSNFAAPVPRAALFNLDLTVLLADWNPRFNILAVGTESQSTARDGLYLLNADFENIVLLDVIDLPRGGILDWSNKGMWLAYSTENGALAMINSQSRATVTLRSFTQPRPALLPQGRTGWTSQDDYYIFSDDIFQALYAVTTEGLSRAGQVHPDFVFDPFEMQLRPDSSQILALQDSQVYLNDFSTGELSSVDLIHSLEGKAFFTADGAFWVNSLIGLPDGDFAECLRVDLDGGEIQFMREILQDASISHTHCLPLEGGTYLAVASTDELQALQTLPDDWAYQLHLLSADLRNLQPLTDQYQLQIPLAFSATYGQLILPLEGAFIVYNLRGDSKTLVSFSDLGLKSSLLQFEFEWQN